MSNPIELVANHFVLNTKLSQLYQYDVNVYFDRINTSTQKKKFKCKYRKKNVLAFEDARKKWPLLKEIAAVYDGERICYTNKEISTVGISEFTHDYDGFEEYTVEISPVQRRDGGSCKLDLAPLCRFLEGKGQVQQEILTALTIILRYAPSLDMIQIYQGFYRRPPTPQDIDGLEVWPGYCFSIVPGPQRLHFNLDLSHKLFYAHCKLLDLIKLDPYFELNSLVYTRIYTTYRGYKKSHIICSFGLNAIDQKFSMEDSDISILDYFREKYKISLQCRDWPVVNVSKGKPAYIPIELCFLEENQPFNGSLSPFQQDKFIKETAIPPEKRFQLIEQKVKEFNSTSRLILKNFKIEISNQPLSLIGNKINSPDIRFKDKAESPRDGAWNVNNFCNPIPLKRWIVISFCRKEKVLDPLQDFIKRLKGNKVGVSVCDPLKVYFHNDKTEPNVRQFLNTCFISHEKLQFVLLLLTPDTGKFILKHMGDTILKIPTICIKEKHFKKGKKKESTPKCHSVAFINNILLKINTKLSGINWVIADASKPDIFKRPFIVMGADVNHASPRGNTPSIAAVVINQDRFYNHYKEETREQPQRDDGKQRTEIIMDFENMTKSLLSKFQENNLQYPPASLLFFRDGVGEGQFEEVREKELKALHKNCQEIFKVPPKITFVIAVKRHHTRFKPKNKSDGVGKNRNIPPGTLATNSVIQKGVKEYFLCSQSCFQGTIAPTKYCVLHDDNNLSAAELYYTTFCLCHLYVKCARSISIPVVVQYAHHWALKGKDYFMAAEFLEDDDYADDETDASLSSN